MRDALEVLTLKQKQTAYRTTATPIINLLTRTHNMTVDTTELTDDQLVALYAKGCDKAFETLLSRHESSVLSYISFLAQDKELSGDLFQDLWIKVITQLREQRYKSEGRFRSWLMRLAHNLVMDHFRKAKALPAFSDQDTQASCLENLSDESHNAEQEWIYHETLADLNLWIAQLSDEQQEIILLRYHQNLSFKEIAQQRGISINTALGRMRYALINLRKIARA